LGTSKSVSSSGFVFRRWFRLQSLLKIKVNDPLREGATHWGAITPCDNVWLSAQWMLQKIARGACSSFQVFKFPLTSKFPNEKFKFPNPEIQVSE
jgi:hypothetical protein